MGFALTAQQASQFTYDQIRVNGMMEQIDESTTAGQAFLLLAADTAAGKKQDHLGDFFIGFLPGMIMPGVGCLIGGAIGTETASIISIFSGSLIGLVGPPLIMGLKTHDRDKVLYSGAGSLTGTILTLGLAFAVGVLILYWILLLFTQWGG